MRGIALFLASMVFASPAVGGVSATLTSQGCPVACRSVIDVRTWADDDSPAALFLAIFPERAGAIDWQVGGYWTGDDWTVSATPIAWRIGPLRDARERVEVSGGLCARILQSGGEPGAYAVVVGHGRIPDLGAAARDAQALRASLDHLAENPEVAKLLADYDKAIADASASNALGAIAAQDMMDRGMQRVAARISCGSQ